MLIGLRKIISIKTNSGIIAAATIEPNDTYLVIRTTTANMIAAQNNAIGASIRNTPTPVATPFPPRNLNHTGKICPAIAAIAAAAVSQSMDGPPSPMMSLRDDDREDTLQRIEH